MTPQQINDVGLNLPEGIKLWAYGDLLILSGPGLNRDRFKEIKSGLPGEIKKRVIGWRLVQRQV